MNRHRAVATVLVLLAIPLGAAAAPERPNVVLCMADDQGLGDMAYTGHPRVWKLHRLSGEGDGPRHELYRLADDPGEQTDLASEHPRRVEAMASALDAWMRSVLDSLNGTRPSRSGRSSSGAGPRGRR